MVTTRPQQPVSRLPFDVEPIQGRERSRSFVVVMLHRRSFVIPRLPQQWAVALLGSASGTNTKRLGLG